MSSPDRRSIDDLIAAVPWGRLALAYGFALDAPVMLRGQVTATDYDAAFEEWMFTAVVHQGTPYSATVPTLWLMRRIVDERPNHPALGTCLAAVAECAAALSSVSERQADSARGARMYHNEKGEPLWASALPPDFVPPPKTPNWVAGGPYKVGYFEAATLHLETLMDCVSDWQGTVAQCLYDRVELESALQAGAAIVTLWGQGPVAEALAGVAADHVVADRYRAGAVFALSRAGRDVAQFVTLGDRASRFAMALGQPGDTAHIEVLIDELDDLHWLTATLPHGLPGAQPWLVAATVAAVLDQTSPDDADERLANALAKLLARPSGPLGATYEWGPVLAWAFKDRVQTGVVTEVPLPDSLTPLQGRLLAALVSNDEVWTPRSGNDSLALRRVGLPHDRAAVASLVKRMAPRPRNRWLRRS